MNWQDKIIETKKDLELGNQLLEDVFFVCPERKDQDESLFIRENYLGVSPDFDAFLMLFEYLQVDFHFIYGTSADSSLFDLNKRFGKYSKPAELLYIGHDCGTDPFLLSVVDGSIYRMNTQENFSYSLLSDSFGEFIGDVIFGENHMKLYPGESFEDIQDGWTQYLQLKGWL